MAKIESYAPGSFCWAELATTDTAAAKQFYTSLFGWTVTEFPIPGGIYTIFQAAGNDAAAMFSAHAGMPLPSSSMRKVRAPSSCVRYSSM